MYIRIVIEPGDKLFDALMAIRQVYQGEMVRSVNSHCQVLLNRESKPTHFQLGGPINGITASLTQLYFESGLYLLYWSDAIVEFERQITQARMLIGRQMNPNLSEDSNANTTE